MIVRISGEGQFDVPDDAMESFNQYDSALESALNDSDESSFRKALGELLDAVRGAGTPVAVDTLEPSDLVLPHSDATIDEVREVLGEEGLIPG